MMQSMIVWLMLWIASIQTAEVDPALLDIPEIKSLDVLVADHYLTKHDFLRCFQEGKFANMTEAASIFAANHFVYSRNFINYLETVAAKIDSDEIKVPILENINEESGNYEASDIVKLKEIGIEKEWYNNIPHKVLSQRFFDALELDIVNDLDSESPGAVFTNFMLDIYAKSNVCVSLAIIGFAIEETVSTLYEFIWNGLNSHTALAPADIVFFPLHIFLDDGHADLLKLGFKHYLSLNNTMCDDAESVIMSVLDHRVAMFDAVRQQIEAKQGQQCEFNYSPLIESCKAEQIVQVEVTTDGAVIQAQKESLFVSSNGTNEWNLLDKMAISARILAEQGHGYTLSGQISCMNRGNGTVFVNAYGKALEMLTVDDFIEIDADLKTVNGRGFANKATNFHFAVYAKRQDLQCLVHTHPPKVSALSLIGEPLWIAHMDVMALWDVQYLPIWPGIPFGDEEGTIISAVLGQKSRSALLAHHGLIVGGSSIEEAVYRAYFMERAATMQLDAMAAVGGDMSRLKKVNESKARKARDWRASKGPMNAHFNAWANIALMNANNTNNNPLRQ